MHLSFTKKKNIRKNFGKLKESLSIPNLIEVQKKSYDEFIRSNEIKTDFIKGLQRVFNGIFPIEDLVIEAEYVEETGGLIDDFEKDRT